METRLMRRRLSNAEGGRPRLSPGNGRREKVNEWVCEARRSTDPHTVSRRPDSLSHCRPAYATGQDSSHCHRLASRKGRVGGWVERVRVGVLLGAAVEELGWDEEGGGAIRRRFLILHGNKRQPHSKSALNTD